MRNFFSIVYKQNNLFIHVCVLLLFSSMTSLPAYAYLEGTGNRLYEKN
jgi:hypothetical protein